MSPSIPIDKANAPDPEMERLRKKWQQRYQSVRKAWLAAILRKSGGVA